MGSGSKQGGNLDMRNMNNMRGGLGGVDPYYGYPRNTGRGGGGGGISPQGQGGYRGGGQHGGSSGQGVGPGNMQMGNHLNPGNVQMNQMYMDTGGMYNSSGGRGKSIGSPQNLNRGMRLLLLLLL